MENPINGIESAVLEMIVLKLLLKRNPINGIERFVSIRSDDELEYYFPNPINGIESTNTKRRSLYHKLTLNPINGIERFSWVARRGALRSLLGIP